MKVSILTTLTILLTASPAIRAASAVSPPRASATLPSDAKPKGKPKKNAAANLNGATAIPDAKLVPLPQHPQTQK